MNEKVAKKKQQAIIRLTELQLEAVKADDAQSHSQAGKAIEALNYLPATRPPV